MKKISSIASIALSAVLLFSSFPAYADDVAVNSAEEVSVVETEMDVESDTIETETIETEAIETEAIETEAAVEASDLSDEAPQLMETHVTAQGKCGENLTFKVYDDKEMVISGTGPMAYPAGLIYYQSVEKVTFESGPTTIENRAFALMPELKELVISDTITEIKDSAFLYCKKLETVDFSNARRLKTIGDSAFYGCESLKDLACPRILETISENAFAYCKAMTSVTMYPAVKTLGKNAFANCTSLETADLTCLADELGEWLFDSCTSLKSVKLPVRLKTIGGRAFLNCAALESIELPDTLVTIGQSAFSRCSALKSVAIPASVTSIATDAFRNCSDIKRICFLGDKPKMAEDVFRYDPTFKAYYPYDKDSWTYISSETFGGHPVWIPVAEGCKPVPVGRITVASTANGAQLSWSGVPGADGYLIYGIRPGKPYGGIGTTTETTYLDTKATLDGYTYYWVYAYFKDEEGKMTPGGCTKYAYGRKIFTPAAVTNLKAASVVGGVQLSWSASEGATGYLIYGRRGSTGTYGYISMTTTATTFKDANALKDDYNFYWVYPYYKDFNGKMWTGSCTRYVYAKAK